MIRRLATRLTLAALTFLIAIPNGFAEERDSDSCDALLLRPPAANVKKITVPRVPRRARHYLPRLSSEMILNLIQEFHKAGLPVNSASFKSGNADARYTAIIVRVTGGPAFTHMKVMRDAEQGHGKPWSWWLKEAGLDPDVVSRRVAKLPEDKIVAAIQALHAAGFNLTETSIRNDIDTETARNIVFEATGRRLMPSKIYHDATSRYRHGWSWWLNAAGFDPAEVMREGKPRLGAEVIVKTIRALVRARQPVDFISMLLNSGGNAVKRIISEQSGRPLTAGELLFDATRRHKRAWDEWLEFAELDAATIRANSPHAGHPNYPAEQIVAVILAFAQRGWPVNYEAFAENWNESPESLELIFQLTGKHVKPMTIMVDATYKHGRRWDVWLQEAGFDPNEIRLRGSAPFQLLSAARKAEFASNYNAVTANRAAIQPSGQRSSRGGNPIEKIAAIEAPQLSDLERKEITTGLALVRTGLSTDDQLVLDTALDYFAYQTNPDAGVMAEYISTRLDRAYGQEDVTRVLMLIKNDPAIRDLLVDIRD